MLYNCYKRDDIFVCRHDSHRDFDHRVSAYHVLHAKGCYPEGCIDFLWKCKLLGKGGTCPKGYQHVGTNCGQCRHYDEEKIQRYPALLVSEEAYAQFLDECARFDEWLDQHVGHPAEIGGRVTDIRPHLTKQVSGRRTALTLRGFLVRLKPGYIGRDGFEDALYLRLSGAQQRRHRIAPGDVLEAQARIHFDRGRLVGAQTRRIYIEERSGEEPARWDRALLDRVGAVSVAGQPGRCLRCSRGLLVDVEDPGRRGRKGPRREVLCLEGIGRPRDCPYEALQAMHGAQVL